MIALARHNSQDTKSHVYKIQEPSVDCTWINRRPDLWYVKNPQRVCGPGRRVAAGRVSGISRIYLRYPLRGSLYLLCSHLPAHLGRRPHPAASP
eukprot:scaffold105382_cov61-Phaeocystis_antarctica.AAC.2